MNEYTITLVDQYGERTTVTLRADAVTLTEAGDLSFTVLGVPVRMYARGEWVKAEKS